eukprot:CAMPEP_0197306582 /NCGR_PEP_ID=MMETSP0891-20130614/3584_1 /TAXON_ID=44058 ORGANISM="Aureoumbra lagunensis, Strain CCMP1510" /NCGR_SAMPLE_ID=MMETSP0891 /ASSEMBLY_ACC=CAM_ASM_000534 /LENGTH=294 /DNA_ID=CAMNT_0042789011 /DNA_START=295 /DNA_END=1182 /DNA_ORIENTATION=-
MSDLKLDPECVVSQKRVYWLYLPIYEWLQRQCDEQQNTSKTLVVGLQCPQGGGKTTMCQVLEGLFAAEGKHCSVISIDDFYLPHKELEKVAARHSTNPLLAGRGPPGTHDATLMRSTIMALCSHQGVVALPRYDKTAHDGSGDRRPVDQWPKVQAPVDIIILEGWCLGFLPQENIDDPHLRTINQFLRTDLAPIYGLFDSFITLTVDDPAVVYDWREQAEAKSRAEGLGAMSKSQVRAFVDRYMPLYKQYLPAFYATFLPSNVDGDKKKYLVKSGSKDKMLRIPIDRHRTPTLP